METKKENKGISIEAAMAIFRQTFRSVKTEEFEHLFRYDRIKEVPKGESLYHEGTRIRGCFFMLDGAVKIFLTGIEGKDQIIRFGKPGDIIGFRSAIRKELACTTTITLADSYFLYIPESDLWKLLEDSPAFSYEMLQIACRELGDANRYIKEMAQQTVRARLAEALLQLSREFGLEADGTLKLSISREELSNFIGTATETLIRLLSDFKNEKLIETKGRRIRILNLPEIQHLAQ